MEEDAKAKFGSMANMVKCKSAKTAKTAKVVAPAVGRVELDAPDVVKWLDRVLTDISTESLQAPPESSTIDDLVLALRIVEIKQLPDPPTSSPSSPSSYPSGRLEWAKLHLMAQYSKKYYERMSEKLNDFDKINRCIICLTDLGFDNPRQLCNKTSCEWQY